MSNRIEILNNVEEAFELIWNNTNDAIFIVGQNGAVLAANPTFTDILGWTNEDLSGVTPPPFFIDVTSDAHEKHLKTLRNGKNINYFVTKRKSKDGEVLDILATYRAINKGNVLAVVMYKDFTEHIEIQKKLEASEECYRRLVEFLPDAIIVQNHHHIVFVNPATMRLFGQEDARNIIGRQMWNFLFSEDKTRIEKKLTEMMLQEGTVKPKPLVEKFIRSDYNVLYLEITAIPIVYEGEPVMQILLKDISDRKRYEMQLEYFAFHDPLTGLRNRRSFMEIFDQSIRYANKSGNQLALLYIDLDRFKYVNDTLGHEIGDELLIQFSIRLLENSNEQSVQCRMGGDEFLILLNDVNSDEDIIGIVEKLHNALNQTYQISGHSINITPSIGISIYPKDGANSNLLIRRADEALYNAKKNRNQYKFY